jgi:hypothetical protein
MTTNAKTIPTDQWLIELGLEISSRSDAAMQTREDGTIRVSEGWLRGVANDLMFGAAKVGPVTPAEVRAFAEGEDLFVHADADDDLLRDILSDFEDTTPREAFILSVLTETNALATARELDARYAD